MPPTATPVPGSLRGVVVNSLTGEPISGATVTLQQDRTTRTATTDGAGRYVFSDPATGVASSVRAGAPSYVAIPESRTVFTQVRSTHLSHMLKLQPEPGVLRGMVTDQTSGDAIPGTTYSVVDRTGNMITTGVTDSVGRYRVDSISPASYRVTFAHRDYPSTAQGDGTVISAKETVVDGKLVAPPARIRGTVLNILTSDPVPGATVTLTQGSIVRVATADQQGRYAFENVFVSRPSSVAATAENYLPTTASSVQFAVAPGGEANQILLLTAPPGALRGTITDRESGETLGDATVQVIGPTGALAATISTAADGRYQVLDLVPGRYTVSASRQGFLGASGQGNVLAGQTAVVDLSLVTLRQSLSGVIADQFTGVPIPGATVTLFDSSGARLGEITADALGQYAYSSLAPGQYSITTTAEGYVAVPASSARAAVTVGAATVQNLQLRPPLQALGTVLTGVATDVVTGKIIPDATVQVFNANDALAGATTTDGEGRYRITTLVPGDYSVTGWASGYVNTVHAHVVMLPNTTTVRDIPLVPLANSLTGIVLDQATGLPIRGALVELLDNSGQVLGTTFATSSGTFAYAPVAAGSYLVRGSAPDYRMNDDSSAQVVVPVGGRGTATLFLAPSPGRIGGVVTDRTTGLPIPGATVQLVGPGNFVLDTITTDELGSYETGDLPVGVTYILRFSAVEYAPAMGQGTTVVGRRTDVNAQLVRAAGAITGIVQDQQSLDIIPGAAVILVGPTGAIVDTAVADLGGLFAFVPPAPGPYLVQAQTPADGPSSGGYRVIPVSSRPITSLLDQEVSVQLLLARQPSTLAGIVVDEATGAPLAGTAVVVGRERLDGGSAAVTVVSDAEGRWELGQVPPGAYLADASLVGYWPAGGVATVAPGQTGFIRIALAKAESSQGGTVRDPAGRPVVGATVTLRCPVVGVAESNPIGIVRTDAGGHFVVPVPANRSSIADQARCSIVADHPDYFPMSPMALSLPSSQGMALDPVDLVLAGRPATLSITTVDDRTGRTISGVEVLVQALPTEAEAVRLQTDSTGFVRVSGLTPGDYRLTATKPGYATKQVEVFASPNRTFELRLRLSLALTGIVTDVNSGEIIPFARVTLYRVGEPAAPGTGRSRRVDGQASIPQVQVREEAQTAQGDLVLFAMLAGADEHVSDEALATAVQRWRDAVADGPVGDVLGITSAEETRRFALETQRRVLGQVVGSVVADEKGKFWFDLIDEGDYRAVAEAPGWYSIDESEDSGNVTIEGPLLVVPLKLTRLPADQRTVTVTPFLPRTGQGGLAAEVVE